MSKIKIYIASVPLATGITEYDTDQLLKNLPADLKPVDREPSISISSNELFFVWRCHKKTLSTLVINYPVPAANGTEY